VTGKKKQSIPLSPKAFRRLFLWSHWVVPSVAVFVIFAHVFWCLELSWELIVLIGAALMPFLLPLLFVYVGKIGAIEMRDDIFDPEIEDEALPPEAPLNNSPNRQCKNQRQPAYLQALISRH
jgi:hypothetical protein